MSGLIKDVSAVEKMQTYSISEEDVNLNIEKDRIKILKQQSYSRIADYVEYRYENLPIKYVTASGFAGNCPVGGVKFSTGGGFYWSEGGGQNVSVSINVGYGPVSLSVNLGKRETSKTGYICNAPTKTSFYRLWSKATYKVMPQKVYGRSIGSSFQYLYTIYPKALYDLTLEARKV